MGGFGNNERNTLWALKPPTSLNPMSWTETFEKSEVNWQNIQAIKSRRKITITEITLQHEYWRLHGV